MRYAASANVVGKRKVMRNGEPADTLLRLAMFRCNEEMRGRTTIKDGTAGYAVCIPIAIGTRIQRQGSYDLHSHTVQLFDATFR